VFASWGGKRAVDYRRQFNITPAMANGTAVNVCTMVFGNRGDDSGTGVGFTRDPGTGENLLYGEYLVNAQAKTWSRASAPPSRCPCSRPTCRRWSSNSTPCATGWRATTKRCRTSNSPKNAHGLTALGAAMTLMQAPDKVRADVDGLRRQLDPMLVESVIVKKERMLRKVRSLFETNPMLGHRGVRLGISFPEIYQMQIRAILEAAAECQAAGIEVHPKIKVPQVCTAQELKIVKKWVDAIHEEIKARTGKPVKFQFGTMIEVVRACMRAETLAEESEFFSFGTNDLTQAAFSFSREDAENKFLPLYTESGVLQDNPFEVLDEKGVGKLMDLAVKWGRSVKPDLLVGICGEHGGHPAAIAFCDKIGLDYVSCSGPRVPVARLAAAHAALKA
jgi:pyruvate,orthophosphate dikinase